MRTLVTFAAALALTMPGAAAQVSPTQATSQAASAASLAGKWVVSTQTDQGEMSSSLDLKQEGTKITGALASEMGNSEVAGEYAEGNLSFSLSMDTGSGPLELVFTGTLQEDGTLAGIIDFGEGTLPWTATRDAAPSAAGKWSMSINSPQGATAASLDLKIAEKAITGSMNSELGTAELEGEVDGLELYFGIYMDDGQGGGFEIWFSGAMSADGATMAGTFDFGQGPMEWTAKRAN